MKTHAFVLCPLALHPCLHICTCTAFLHSLKEHSSESDLWFSLGILTQTEKHTTAPALTHTHTHAPAREKAGITPHTSNLSPLSHLASVHPTRTGLCGSAEKLHSQEKQPAKEREELPWQTWRILAHDSRAAKQEDTTFGPKVTYSLITHGFTTECFFCWHFVSLSSICAVMLPFYPWVCWK